MSATELTSGGTAVPATEPTSGKTAVPATELTSGKTAVAATEPTSGETAEACLRNVLLNAQNLSSKCSSVFRVSCRKRRVVPEDSIQCKKHQHTCLNIPV